MVVAIKVSITNTVKGYKISRYGITEVINKEEAFNIAERLGKIGIKLPFDMIYFVSKEQHKKFRQKTFDIKVEYTARQITDTECIKRFQEDSRAVVKEFEKDSTKFFKSYTGEID